MQQLRKAGALVALVLASVLLVGTVAANASTPPPVKLKVAFRGNVKGKAVAHISKDFQGRVHVTGLNVGVYRLHLTVERTYRDINHNVVGTASNDFQICSFRVKTAGAVGHCGGVRKNVPWTHQSGDVVSAEILGANNLEIVAAMS